MHKLIVKEVDTGKTSLAADCRISALSTADYCLGRRKEAEGGYFLWSGTCENVRRLFEAERLCSCCQSILQEGKVYAVIFISSLPACA